MARPEPMLPLLPLVALLLLAPAPARAADLVPRIANGVLTNAYPTTGALLHDGFQACSGTMIGCQTFLTAAHCVCRSNGSSCNPVESEYRVFLQHAGLFDVASITPNPSYVDASLDHDVAVVRLASPASAIAPTPLAAAPPPFDTTATIVGFGAFEDTPITGSGIKRRGEVRTAPCGALADDDLVVCWAYEPPFGPAGSDSNTCPGDSGGPLFLAGAVAGVTSFGTSACDGSDESGDTSVFAYRSFIEGAAGADLGGGTCGGGAQVGDAATEVHGFSGTLSGAGDAAFHGFDVAPGTHELRVTMNGQDDASESFDLWVRAGAMPDPSQGLRDCVPEAVGQFAACTFADPTPGPWYAMARSTSSAGAYQVTATTFMDKSLLSCGDGTVDPGEACDDGNTTSGDGCDALCRREPSAGCPPQPDPTCLEPRDGGARLSLQRRGDPAKNRLRWKWKGSAPGRFGDPPASTDYDLCVYDSASGVAGLAFSAGAPAGTDWSAGKRGFRYRGPGGATTLRTLRLGDGRRTSLRAKGRGIDLGALPLAQDGTVVVQLHRGGGVCFGSSFSAPAKKSDAARFRDRSDP